MTEVDREIALALLKRLRQRELITEAVYTAACSSHFYDSKNFFGQANPDKRSLEGEGDQRA